MRAIDSCVSLAEKLGKHVIVFWGRDHYLNCKFSDLFQPSHSYQVIEESQLFGKKALFPYLPGSSPTSLLKKGLYQFTKSILAIEKEIWFEDLDHALLPLRTSIDPDRIRSMKDYEDKAIKYLAPFVTEIEQANNVFLCSAWRIWPEKNYRQRFIPLEHLKHKIADATGKYDQTIGLHIRRGDHDLATQYSTLSKFKVAIEKELEKNASCTFFLATDSLQNEQELKHLYQNKILSNKKQSYSRNSTLGVQDALVDLYCLSETEKVLGSYFSSFSQIAAEISGIDEQTILN